MPIVHSQPKTNIHCSSLSSLYEPVSKNLLCKHKNGWFPHNIRSNSGIQQWRGTKVLGFTCAKDTWVTKGVVRVENWKPTPPVIQLALLLCTFWAVCAVVHFSLASVSYPYLVMRVSIEHSKVSLTQLQVVLERRACTQRNRLNYSPKRVEFIDPPS